MRLFSLVVKDGKRFQKLFAQVIIRQSSSLAGYIQGQSPEREIREYFYYVDHQGMLFLDDAKMKNFTSCYKEQHFLKFFFKRLKMNNTLRYTEFPYLSLCGKERNFLRCDDLPIVFTEIFDEDTDDPQLSYNHGKRFLTVPFEPEKICMVPDTGRVYHPGPARVGGVGLLSDKLSIAWSTEKRFVFGNGEENPPTQFKWQGRDLELTNELVNVINRQTESDTQSGRVVHDRQGSKFVIELSDGKEAYILYERPSKTTVHFLTTQVPSDYEGQGVGQKLAKAAFDFCLTTGLRFKSSCWYLDLYLKKHPEYSYLSES